NVAYQIVGGMKFFERAEVKDLLGYLRLIDNPRSDADLLRIINVPARGIGDRTVDALLKTASDRGWSLVASIPGTGSGDMLKPAAKKKLHQFAELLSRLRGEAPRLTPHEMARRVLDETGYKAELEKQDTAESDARIENLEEFVGSIEEYERDAEES